jgi:hypothetical protein
VKDVFKNPGNFVWKKIGRLKAARRARAMEGARQNPAKPR